MQALELDCVLLVLERSLHTVPLHRIKEQQEDGSTAVWLLQSEIKEQLCACTDQQWGAWVALDLVGREDTRRKLSVQVVHWLVQAKVLPSAKATGHLLIPVDMAARAVSRLGAEPNMHIIIEHIGEYQGSSRTDEADGFPETLPPAPPTDGRGHYGLTATGYGDLYPTQEEEEYKNWRVQGVRFDRWDRLQHHTQIEA